MRISRKAKNSEMRDLATVVRFAMNADNKEMKDMLDRCFPSMDPAEVQREMQADAIPRLQRILGGGK